MLHSTARPTRSLKFRGAIVAAPCDVHTVCSHPPRLNPMKQLIALIALSSLSMLLVAGYHWYRGFAPARLFSLAMLVFNLGCLVVLPALLGLTWPVAVL